MKKGMMSFNMLMFIPRIIFLVVVIFAIIILVKSYILVSVDTFDAESELVYKRVLYSVNGISYYDKEINRLYPGIVDPNRLDPVILNNSLDFVEEPHVGARIVLKDLNKMIKKTAFYNKGFYDEKMTLFNAGLTKGAGGARAITKENYVLYNENGKLKDGILEVQIVIPNS